MNFGQDFANGVVPVFHHDLANLALVRTRFVFHFGDAVFLEPGIPSLDSAPGELARVAVLIGAGHLADSLDAFADGIARSHVDGAEHPHFQINSGIAHESFFLWLIFSPAQSRIVVDGSQP